MSRNLISVALNGSGTIVNENGETMLIDNMLLQGNIQLPDIASDIINSIMKELIEIKNQVNGNQSQGN